MTNSNNPSDIIQRIQSGKVNDSDLESLRQLLQNNDNETLQQLGKFHVSIDEGREIHIGDRNYFNWSDEAIQAVVEVVQQGKAVAVFNPTGKVTIYNYNNYYREETTTVSVEPTEETDNLPCPYRGLFHFTSEDSEYFFGREVLIEELYQYTETHNFIPVLGASGSGKSSVILAGLVPKLVKAGHWQFTHFRPGKDPFLALAQALVPLYEPNLDTTDGMATARKLAGYFQDNTIPLSDVLATIQRNHLQDRILLIADQFEELYTLCNDEKTRRHFLDTLLQTFRAFAEQSSLSTVLVATMRADFLGNALSYRPVADVLQQGNIMLGPMNETELRDVIEKPAEKLGVTFQSGLVERILDDIEKEPGNLPLLEFALTELWKQRKGKQLTHKAYTEIGEVSGALTRYADNKFSQLSEPEKQQVRRIFVQLVRPGEGTEDTRRVATKTELNTDWKLVKLLADARLVVTGRSLVTTEAKKNSKQHPKPEQQTVEVVHEALIRNWGQLRKWMETDREFRTWQEQLRASMHRWQEMNRDQEQLLRGAALVQAQEKLKERREELSQDEQEFIQLSQQQQEQEQRQKQRQRLQILGGLVVYSVTISLLAINAFIGEKNAKNAEVRANISNLKSRFAATQDFNALIRGIQLGNKLKQVNWAAANTRIQGIDMLREMVYWQGFKEYNSLQHTDEVNSVAFNHNGKLMASASTDTTATIWREDGTVVSRLRGHNEPIYRIKFGYHTAYGDEELIATASKDTTAKIWTTDGNLVATLKHNSPVSRVAFSPKRDLIVTTTDDGTVTFWKFDGSLFQIVKEHKEHKKVVWKIAFNPSGELIATASWDGTVKLWKSDGSLFKTLTEHSDKVYSVAFSPKGDLIATASADNTVKLWTSDGNLINTLEGHQKTIYSVVFNPDGNLIASASYDNNVKLWTSDGQLVNTLEGHSDEVFSVVFNSDSNLIASASKDNTIKLWNSDGNLVDTLEGHSKQVYNAVFSPNGNLIASVSQDSTVKLWKNNTVTNTFEGYNCRRIAFSPNGDLIALACYDKNLYIFDYPALLNSNATPIASGISSRDLASVAFSPKGNYIVTGNANGTVELWEFNGSLVKIKSWKGHSQKIYGIAFHPDGNLIATASRDRKIKLWELNRTEPKKTLEGHEGRVSDVIFSPSGDLIASTSWDGTIKLWKPDSPLPETLKGHSGIVTGVAFNSRGDIIASTSHDNTVKLWKPHKFWKPDSPLPETLKGHSGIVTGVAFNSRGDMIASTSHDNTIKLWKPDGTLIHTLLGHKHRVGYLAFSPNDDVLLTISDDKTLKLWNFNLDNLLERSCNWVSNYLKNNPNVTEDERRICGVEPSATAFFLQGEHLAAEGNIDEAVSYFQKAVKLDSNLSFHSAALSLLIIGKQLAKYDKIDEAITAYNQAQEFDPKLEITASDWNTLCWEGSKYKQAEEVMFACNNAIKLAPDNEWIRNSRGFARALTDDFEGAIEDFERFIELSENAEEKAERQRWIESLKQGKNSFIDEVLQD